VLDKPFALINQVGFGNPQHLLPENYEPFSEHQQANYKIAGIFQIESDYEDKSGSPYDANKERNGQCFWSRWLLWVRSMGSRAWGLQ